MPLSAILYTASISSLISSSRDNKCCWSGESFNEYLYSPGKIGWQQKKKKTNKET